jgi:hypothetical protein
MDPLVQDAERQLRTAGIGPVELVRSGHDTKTFGNGEALFRAGRLLLYFTRDRGQDFLDIATTKAPETFYQFDDVEVAMGWTSLTDVVGKRRPDDLSEVVGRLRSHITELNEAFADDQEGSTRERIQQAAKARGERFTERLRGIAGAGDQ